MLKSFEEMQAFGKENFEAYAASAAALTKGFQTIATEAADYSKRTFEKSAAVVEQFAGAKSPDKAFEVQQAYAKEAFESFFGQANKMGELYLAVAKDVYRPFEAKLAQFGVKTPK